MFSAAAGERDRVEGGVEVDGGESFVGFESGKEVVVATLLFDDFRRGLAVLADAFVERLAVAAGGYCGHEDVFGGHEGELFAEGAGDDVGVDDQAARHVLVEDQNRRRSRGRLAGW